ncbi:MAG: biopolymer transporter ExbD [Kiritimatiellaeota bacterium]|nr:biopolymer transporter ExbD [Kiritimatiellota bacterium]
MARKRKKIEQNPGELNLVAMIDVAFQLLNFFIITSHPVDVLAHLDVFRPSPDKKAPRLTQPPPVIRIEIFSQYTLLNDQRVTRQFLVDFLANQASFDTSKTVLIQCAQQSTHGQLVELLDECARLKLWNLSVISST